MDWPGSRWWKFDLHVHTPASHDYRGNGGADDYAAIVRRALAQDVSGLVIADHNTCAGIEPMRAAVAALRAGTPEGDPVAASLRLFALYPGVEVTCASGTHMLAVFAPDTTRDRVLLFLGDCGVPPERHGEPDILAQCAEQQFCQIAERHGALAIAAHIDGPRGALALPAGQPQIQLFDCPALSALEIHNRLLPLPADVRRNHAIVSGSDAHRPEEVGARYTWLRMTQPSFEGLRLALQDGQAESSLLAQTDPNTRHAGSFIEAVRITGTRYMGFDQGHPAQWQQPFSPWLNTIIGHRGSGKSTLVALMRTVLRRDQNLPGRIQDEQDSVVRQPSRRGDKGVVTADTSVDLTYNKEGLLYRLHWDPAAARPALAARNSDGEWEDVPGDVRAQFPVRIFSQNELFALADDPAALLRIIDEAPQVGRVRWDAEWRVARERVLDLRRQLRRTDALQNEFDRLAGQLYELRRRLALLETPENRRTLEMYERLHRQRVEIESRAQEMDELASGMDRTANTLQWADLPPALFAPDDPADAEILDIFTEAGRRAAEAAARLGRDTERLRAGAERLRAILVTSDWASRAADVQAKYEALRRETGQEQGVSPDYALLLQQRHELERRVSALAEQIAAQPRLRAELVAAGESLVALRQRLSDQRQAFVNEVLAENPLVRIRVECIGDVAPFLDEVWQRLGILRFDESRQVATGGLLGAADTAERFNAIKQLVAAVDGASATGADPWGVDKRFISAIRRAGMDALDDVVVTFPEDLLAVEYRRSPGDRYQPLQSGSPGQKSAALLAFFLSYGSEPLVLDQPENDLDNELISTLVVEQIKALKPRRQLIIVTHNANIVVNADAEAVFTFEARGGQTRVLPDASGGLDEAGVREAVCRVLEGGRAAFEARFRRIAGRP